LFTDRVGDWEETKRIESCSISFSGNSQVTWINLGLIINLFPCGVWTQFTSQWSQVLHKVLRESINWLILSWIRYTSDSKTDPWDDP